ncbi:unnamed protein product, partial [Choristocarpus tenellus]
KARRPVRQPYDPILANQRWPTPLEVPARHRTEYLHNFSWDHSVAAYGLKSPHP